MEIARVKVAAKVQESEGNFEKSHIDIENEVFNELMYDDNDSKNRIVGYGVGVTKNQVCGLKGMLRRGYADELGRSSIEVLGVKAHLVSVEKKNDEFISQLQQRNEELERRTESLEIRAETLEKMNETLVEKNEMLEKRNEELVRRNVSLEMRSEELFMRNDLLEKRYEDLIARNDLVDQRNEELAARNDQLFSQVSSLLEKLSKY